MPSKFEFKRLTEVRKSDVIELMNNPLVRRHMPLATGRFDDKAYEAFIADKERLWTEHGYGPWAFVSDGRLIGWGGLQFEQGDADLALVLHPHYWGMGRVICKEITRRAFDEFGFESMTALLPVSRKRVKGLIRLGFQEDGEVLIEGNRFLRYRLFAPHKKQRHTV